MQVETIKHLFWECTHIRHLWNNIANVLQNSILKPDITYERSLFGTLENRNNITVQAKHYIFIATKHYIFQTKQNKEIPNFNHLKNKLKRKIFIEEQIAQNRFKLEIHNIKWRPFLDHI